MNIEIENLTKKQKEIIIEKFNNYFDYEFIDENGKF